MITANFPRVVAALLIFLATITASACGPTGPDGSGGAGGTTSSTTSTSSSTSTGVCPGPGTAKAGEPCATDCDCACLACGTLTDDAGTMSVCTAACEPSDGGP